MATETGVSYTGRVNYTPATAKPLKKYLTYKAPRSGSRKSKTVNVAQQNALAELNRSINDLNRAIDQGNYYEATTTLSDKFQSARTKAQRFGAVPYTPEIDQKIEQAKQDLLKEQAAQRQAQREQLELQASRASGQTIPTYVRKGKKLVKVDEGEVPLGADIKLTPEQEKQLSNVGVTNTGGKLFSREEVFARDNEKNNQRNLQNGPVVIDTGKLGPSGGKEVIIKQPEFGSVSTEPSPGAVTEVPFEVDRPSVFTAVDRTIVPAKNLDEVIYLPDASSNKKYNELLDKSITGLGGSELAIFLREQQTKLDIDVKRYNTLLFNANLILEGKKFKDLQNKVLEINNRQLAGETFTKEEIEQAKKTFDEYNKEFDRYQRALNEVIKLEEKIDRGYKGTGWNLLKERSEELKRKTGGKIDATLARSLLKGGVIAYDIEKTVLATKVGGALLGPLVTSTAVGQDIVKTITPVARFFGSKPVIGASGALLGIGSGVKEYKSSGDIPYAIGAGLGGAGGFYASTLIGRPAKSINKNELKQLQKAKGKGSGYIYKENGEYKIVTFENRQAGGFNSDVRTISTIQKQGNNWIITSGKGQIFIVDSKGNVITSQGFDFGGSSTKAGENVVLKGNIIKELDKLQLSKGQVVVDINNKIIKESFKGIGIKDGNIISSYVDNLDISKSTLPKDSSNYKISDIKLDQPGKPISFNIAPDYYRAPFDPKSNIRFEQITSDKVNLLLGTDGKGNLLTNFARGQNGIRWGSYNPTPTSTPSTIQNVNTITGSSLSSTPSSGGSVTSLIGQGTDQISSNTLSFLGVTSQAASNVAFTGITPTTDFSALSGYSGFLVPSTESSSITLQTLTPIDRIKNKTQSNNTQTSETVQPIQTNFTSQSQVSGTTNAIAQLPVTATPTPPSTQNPVFVRQPTRPIPPTKGNVLPTIPYSPIPGIPDIDKKVRYVKAQGYNAEYLPQGQKKYKKINKVPQTIMSALSTMARKVDNTISARGRIVKAKSKTTKKGKEVKVQDTGDKYFMQNRNKFRSYRSVRGRKGQLKSGEFIEKQRYRLDKPGERKQIQSSRQRRSLFGF